MINHYVKATNFGKKDFLDLFRRTDKLINEKLNYKKLCNGKVIATLFFEPSTRTSSAFQSGIIKMGGGWIGESEMKNSSISKGEDFADTIKSFSGFADLLVIRHPDDMAAENAIKYSEVPVINGGCGTKEHPLAFSFLYKAHRELKKINNLKVGFYGTPGINRMSKSLLQILGMFKSEVYIDDLGMFPFPADLEKNSRNLGLKKINYCNLDEFIGKVDMLLVTDLIKKNMAAAKSKPVSSSFFQKFKPINMNHINQMKKNSILTMTIPRTIEIEHNVDMHPKAAYMRISKEFQYLNMALITKLLNIKI